MLQDVLWSSFTPSPEAKTVDGVKRPYQEALRKACTAFMNAPEMKEELDRLLVDADPNTAHLLQCIYDCTYKLLESLFLEPILPLEACSGIRSFSEEEIKKLQEVTEVEKLPKDVVFLMAQRLSGPAQKFLQEYLKISGGLVSEVLPR